MQSVMYSFSGKTSSFCSKPRIFQLESQENTASRKISMIFTARLETLSDYFRFKKPIFKYCSNEKV